MSRVILASILFAPVSALQQRAVQDAVVQFYKFKNQRSGYYLVGGRHAASCDVFSNSHEVAQCPFDDASDDGFWWSVDADGRITNKKNSLSLYTQNGDGNLKLSQNAAGDDGFKWSILSDTRIENLKFNTFLCAGAWGEHPGDTRVRNLEWTDKNKQLNTNHVPVGYTGFEWERESDCQATDLSGNPITTDPALPGTYNTCATGKKYFIPGAWDKLSWAKKICPADYLRCKAEDVIKTEAECQDATTELGLTKYRNVWTDGTYKGGSLGCSVDSNGNVAYFTPYRLDDEAQWGTYDKTKQGGVIQPDELDVGRGYWHAGICKC